MRLQMGTAHQEAEEVPEPEVPAYLRQVSRTQGGQIMNAEIIAFLRVIADHATDPMLALKAANLLNRMEALS